MWTFCKQIVWLFPVKAPPPSSETYKTAYAAKYNYYMHKYSKLMENRKLQKEQMLDKADKEVKSTVEQHLKEQYGEQFYNEVILGIKDLDATEDYSSNQCQLTSTPQNH